MSSRPILRTLRLKPIFDQCPTYLETRQLVFTSKMFEKHLWKSDILSKDAGHRQVDLLWKDDFPILQDNRELAIQRFKFLQKQFSKNPEFKRLITTSYYIKYILCITVNTTFSHDKYCSMEKIEIVLKCRHRNKID